MAEYKEWDMVREILTCSICLEEADDPRPLLCQHTFCYKCLKKYVEKIPERLEIPCPVCRKLCPLPNGNVDELPESFLYNQLKDANRRARAGSKKNNDKEVSTTNHCSSHGCGQTASSFCKTCKYICLHCEEEHKSVRAMKSHVILTLYEAAAVQVYVCQQCPKHRNKVLELYCEQCELLICCMCHSLEHRHHKCVQLSRKAEAAGHELEDMMKVIKVYLEVCDKMAESVERHVSRLSQSTDNIKQKISAKVVCINKELNDFEVFIKNTLDEDYKNAEKMIQGDSDAVSHLKGSLQSLKFYSDQLYLYGSSCDFVTKIKLIQERLRENNPDNVKITIQELDMTDAEKKLNDLKSYKKLNDTLKETLLTVTKKSDELYMAKIKHKKIVDDLDKQLRQENCFNEKIVADLEKQLNQDKEVQTKRMTDLEKQLQQLKTAKKKLQQENVLLQQEKDANNKKSAEVHKQLLQEKQAKRKAVDDLTKLKSCAERYAKRLAQTEISLKDLKNDCYKYVLPQPFGGTWIQGTDRSGDVTIRCTFPAGTQNALHPRPGQPYPARVLTCWIKKPAEGGGVPEGAEVAALMKRAFDARLLFIVSGNQICWHGAKFWLTTRIRKAATIQRLADLEIK